jgi:hypothetical protein
MLTADFTAYTYDRRGDSSGTAAPSSVDRETDDLAAVITAAGAQLMLAAHPPAPTRCSRHHAVDLAIAKLAAWKPNFPVDDNRPPLPAGYVTSLRDLIRADAQAPSNTS